MDGSVAVAVALGAMAMGGFGAGGSATAQDLPPTRSVAPEFSAKVVPSGLTARGRARAKLVLDQAVRTRDGSHPPALQSYELELDRHVRLALAGIPKCTSDGRQSYPYRKVEERCRDSRIGRGSAKVEVAFADQEPVEVTSRVRIYNGPFRGRTRTFYVFMRFPAPITGAVVPTVKLRRNASGPYRTRLVASIPEIANGAGSITDLRLVFGRRVIFAGCPKGGLHFRADAAFDDGSRFGAGVAQLCEQRGKDI